MLWMKFTRWIASPPERVLIVAGFRVRNDGIQRFRFIFRHCEPENGLDCNGLWGEAIQQKTWGTHQPPKQPKQG